MALSTKFTEQFYNILHITINYYYNFFKAISCRLMNPSLSYWMVVCIKCSAVSSNSTITLGYCILEVWLMGNWWVLDHFRVHQVSFKLNCLSHVSTILLILKIRGRQTDGWDEQSFSFHTSDWCIFLIWSFNRAYTLKPYADVFANTFLDLYIWFILTCWLNNKQNMKNSPRELCILLSYNNDNFEAYTHGLVWHDLKVIWLSMFKVQVQTLRQKSPVSWIFKRNLSKIGILWVVYWLMWFLIMAIKLS